MYTLPTSVKVKDREFTITNNGDFRMVLDCFKALGDAEMSEDYRVITCLLIFYNEFHEMLDISEAKDYVEELVKEMYKFFNCGQPEDVGAKTSKPVIDWDKDSQIVCAAVNNVAKTEIRSLPSLHWWTFMGYYLSVGESVLSTVVGIRNKINEGKKLEKWEKDFKKDNPNYFVWNNKTVADKEAEATVRAIWNSGGDK